MERNARQHGDKLAIEFEDQQITWGQLWQQAEAKSTFFIDELGTDQQAMVALLLTNSIEFVITYLAILQAGHMVLPLDPAYKQLELDAIIDQMQPRLIITSRRYQHQIGRHSAKTLLAGAVKQRPAAGRPLRRSADSQIASLTFTSGTSGKPKAVPNTHANHMWNIKVCSEIWDWTEADSLLLSLPLSHWYGLVMGLSGVIYHANSLYLKEQALKPEELLSELASGRISLFTHVPLAYSKLLEADEGKHTGLTAVRVLISGGAPLAPAIWQEFKQHFGIEIVETYGTSETGRIAGNRLRAKVVGSPGPPMPEVELKLSDEGEVLIKSPGVFPGYYNNPAATAAGKTADGYWRTGDIAELKNGCVFLKGRVQERIRRFSYTVSPRDVEWAVLKHPKVKEIQVLGRQQPGRANDELIYFIVTSMSDKEIDDYCKANLLFAWRPDRVVKLPALPRTPNGKISLSKLKVLAEELSSAPA